MNVIENIITTIALAIWLGIFRVLCNGEWKDIFKNPLDSSKKSKTGRFKLINENNSFKTILIDNDGENMLRTVFRNGELLIEDKFSYIKDRTLNYSSR